MGVRCGWPDFIIIPPTGRIHFLELKRAGESLTGEQDAMRLWAARHGLPFVVAYDMKQALAALIEWGALRPEVLWSAP